MKYQTWMPWIATLAAPAVLTLTGCPEDEGRPMLGTLGGTGSTGGGDSTDGVVDDAEDDDDDDGPEPACVPGSQQDCQCPGGLEGFQVCNDAGSGYDECMCESADDTTDDGSESSSTGGLCGNGVCDDDMDEDCASCEEDCGVCAPCTEAPTCEGAEIPPPNPVEAPQFNVPMAYVPPPEILNELAAEVAEGGMGARLIAAALSEPGPDESSLVGTIRDVFDAHPDAVDAIRRQMAAAGMTDPEQYTIERNAPTTPELIAFAAARPHTTLATGAVHHGTAPAPSGLVPPTDPAAGGDPCDDPRIRIRVARLIVHEEDDDFANDEIFCAITTEGSDHAEIKVTPVTSPLDEGDSVDYTLDSGLIWGQSELTAPKGNILVAYQCIESDTAGNAGYTALLEGLSAAAGDVDGEKIGVDGWVFPAVGIVTGLLAGALTLDGDDLLFNTSQIIGEDQLLPLIYGAFWSVRQEGTNMFSDWDWELRMEMWGCHDYGTGEGPPA